MSTDYSCTRYFIKGTEQLYYVVELEFIIEITCIFGKDISADPSSCTVWPRVLCFHIFVDLDLSGQGFLLFWRVGNLEGLEGGGIISYF